MTQAKQYKRIDNLSHITAGPPQTDADDIAASSATIAETCSAIAKLITAVSKADNNPGMQSGFSDLTEGQADAVWESVGDFASQLARARASSLEDVTGKISIWRHLTPEEDAASETIDETLLRSIMDDIERLGRRCAKA